MLVTSCERNVIYQLDEKPPGVVLSRLLESLPEHEQQLFRQALFIGMEMQDQREYQAGDFLVRNLLGLEPDGGALAIASDVKRWQVVQFHVRDAEASAADLQRGLQRVVESQATESQEL